MTLNLNTPRTFILFDGLNHLCSFANYHTGQLYKDALQDALTTIEYIDPFFASPQSNTTVFFIWDARSYQGQKTQKVKPSSKQYRESLLTEYKSKTRSALIAQTMDAKEGFIEILQEKTIHSITQPGLEADDLIAFFTKVLQPNHSIIVSQDADFLQLVSTTTSIFRNQGWLDSQNFQKIIGLTPSQYLAFKALAGDPSDNIPPIKDKQQSWMWAVNGANTHELSPTELVQFQRNHRLAQLNLWKVKGAVPTVTWRKAYGKLKHILASKAAL